MSGDNGCANLDYNDILSENMHRQSDILFIQSHVIQKASQKLSKQAYNKQLYP